MNSLLLWTYRLLVVPPAVILLPVFSAFNRKIREGLRLRRQPRPELQSLERPLWIHAASGEFEYAKAVIRECKSRYPQMPILVTYFSPTFALSASNFPGVDAALPLPLDLPGPCRSFIKRYRPRLLLISRTDFWPEMLERCRTEKIPVHVMSYTQKDPARLSALQKILIRWRLAWMDQTYCVSAEDEANIRSLNPALAVEAIGDTRYDQVRYRLDHPKHIPEVLRPSNSSVTLVAGSTWTEDERILLPATEAALKSGRLKLILVPHEPTPSHINALKADLERRGLTYALFSHAHSWEDKHVLLVDKVGVLAELYLWADLAFVGGSFRKTVHSVMEALGAGCLTYVGPLHLNNREALEFKALPVLGGLNGLTVVDSATEWENHLKMILSKPDDLKIFAVKLRAEFSRRLGASRKLVDRLEKEITDLPPGP